MNIKIGNTPLIKIKYKYNDKEDYIYSKLESYNLTGSIKDRVAYYIIKRAYDEEKLKKGMTIVEATRCMAHLRGQCSCRTCRRCIGRPRYYR